MPIGLAPLGNAAWRCAAAAVIGVVMAVLMRVGLLGLSGGVGADIVYECSGAGAAAQQLLTLVRRHGQYAQIGLFSGSVAWDLNQLCYKELRATGSNASVPSAWRRALRLMADGHVRTAPLISHEFALEDWRQAFDTFEARAGVKLLIRPEA